ncbi:MAG: dihydrolipoyl dehydrogenase [Magnetococcales bacterium]|nr:dihydrolipoyl dehydrogenase [Magnetococcales bacterium]
MINPEKVVVIGGGPGGYAAAFRAADLGFATTLIDMDANPGGVCLYRGCIPSKALLHVTQILWEARHAEMMGVRFGQPEIDLDRLRSWKQSVVMRLTGALGDLCRRRGVAFIQGCARFDAPGSLVVQRQAGDLFPVPFDHCILATGSRPAWIPGLQIDSPRVMDSTAALALEEIPPTLLIIGGGVIGLELGSVYAALGSRVSIVEMTSGLLPGADRDLVRVVLKRLQPQCHEVMLQTRVTALVDRDGLVHATLEDARGERREASYHRVLMAIGRRPNSEDLGLEKTSVKMERGFVQVNDQMRTADPKIWAIGDLVGGPMLAHKAAHEARVAVEVIAGKKARFAPHAIPAVCYTDPELAWAGLTETIAVERKIPFKAVRFPWGASGRAQTLEQPDGLTKLIVNPEDERILGVGLVGRGAGELIAEGVLAIEMGAVVEDLATTIHPHPTLSETVMEAAEVFFGHSPHYHAPRRNQPPS